MALAKSQQSLKNWSKQKWRTKSGKPSSKTGERYLPEKAIKALSSSEYIPAPPIPIKWICLIFLKKFIYLDALLSLLK